MKNITLLIIVLLSALNVVQASTLRGAFKWSEPGTLTPAYPAPTSQNRYGEYISNVTFTDNGVQLVIDDNDVLEQSQRARFLYGYLTDEVEMRAYVYSDIIITAPEGYVVKRVQFTGAKADGNYLEAYDTQSTFNGQEWSTESPSHEAKFMVTATINCTSITVICVEDAGVDTVVADDNSQHTWYTTTGVVLNNEPTTPGIYIMRKGNTAKKIFVNQK